MASRPRQVVASLESRENHYINKDKIYSTKINMIDTQDGAFESVRPSLRQLEIFRTVAGSGSIRSAARVLNLTQPAVTHAMRELEQALGAQLFARSVKGVMPTEIGISLLRRSHLLFNELRRTRDEIAQLRDGTGGRLSIAFSSAAALLLPAAMEDFRVRRPGVVLDLNELTWPVADDRWHRGGYDFAVVSAIDEPDDDDGLERELLFALPLIVVARAGHPQAEARSLSSLQHCLWLVQGYGGELLRRLYAAQHLPPPTDIITCQSAHLGLQLMARMDALTFVFQGATSDPNVSRGFVKVPLAGPPLGPVRLTLLVRDVQSLTPAARVFIDCLRRAAKAIKDQPVL